MCDDERSSEVLVGVVCDLEDPLGLGRVRVRYPDLANQESDWARLVTPMAGRGRGLLCRPETDELVAVVFERGDPRNALILGGLWSQPDPPPAEDGKAKENNWRQLRSRSGHLVKLDDTAGGERIEIVASDGARRVVLDSAAGKVQVTCDRGDIEVSATAGSVSVRAQNITIEATNTLTLKGGTAVNIN
jgi:uncharacterized protein involved in type VI secretion and phage assembly